MMEKQMGWCMTGVGATYTPACKREKKSKECHDKCLRLLIKPLCYIPCPRNPSLQNCVDDCKIEWPNINCMNANVCNATILDASGRLQEYKTSTAACPDHECFVENLKSERIAENCRSKRFVKEFARRLVALRKLTTGNFGSDIETLAEHYFYGDCLKADCKTHAREDGIRCVQICMSKVRSFTEMEKACAATMSNKLQPLRTVILLWCLLEFDSSRLWTFESLLTFKNIDDYMLYDHLSKCEQEASDSAGKRIPATNFHQIAQIIYEIEQESCEHCNKVNSSKLEYHPYQLELARCELKQCYKSKLLDPNICPPSPSDFEHRLVRFSQCQWKVDLSLSREPFKIWSTYFDEISPIDETNSLRSPNGLKYLQKSSLMSRTGHYVFPYFLVIRGVCDEGFYDEDVYKFINNGGSPVGVISYSTQISRLVFTTFMSARLQSALINLEREDPDTIDYIPKNPLNRINKTTNKYDGKTGCHLNLCYPAFVVRYLIKFFTNSIHLYMHAMIIIILPI